MINKVADIENKAREYIVKAYASGHSPKEIEKELGIAHNTMISLLGKEGIYLDKIDYPSFDITGKKLLVISDTHIGSRYENFSYIDLAYDKGISEGVCACLHAGDLLQGSYSWDNKPISYQLDALDKIYPEVDEFDTNVLLGNHDFSVFESNSEAKQLLEEKKGLINYGYRRVYFTWNGYLCAMDHKIKHFDDELPMEYIAYDFIGHGHELKQLSPTKLKVTTLSDDIINQRGYPGFIIATMNNDHLQIDSYGFKNKNLILKKRDFFDKDLLEIHKVDWNK